MKPGDRVKFIGIMEWDEPTWREEWGEQDPMLRPGMLGTIVKWQTELQTEANPDDDGPSVAIRWDGFINDWCLWNAGDALDQIILA